MNKVREENCVLWERFINGDTQAFTPFYKINYPILYSYGMNLKMKEEQIRDIIHDLFLKLYSTPSIIKDSCTIHSFLLVSLRNTFINQERRQNRLVNLECVEFDFQYSIENDFWDKSEVTEMKSKVDNLIAQLTPRQKEIIYLKFLHQMDYEEIAKIMNMSEQAARNLIYRAIDRIRKNNPDTYPLFLIILSQMTF